MKLIVHELDGSYLEQRVTPERNTSVVAVRPHLYRHNRPAGTLKVQILDASDNVLGESAAVDPDDVGSLDFFHGYVRFDVSAYLAGGEEYKIRLVGTGYSFSESAYIGWCNGYDLGKYEATYTSNNNYTAPLDLEIWERKVK